MQTEVYNISRRVCEVALGDYSLAPVPSINSSQCHSTRKENVHNENEILKNLDLKKTHKHEKLQTCVGVKIKKNLI